MRTRIVLAVVLTSMLAEFATARGPRREMPIPSEVTSRPVTAFVFDFGSTMKRCASVLESRKDYPYERETLHVTTGMYRDNPVVLIQDEHRNGRKGDEQRATLWMLEHFGNVQRFVAVSSSTAITSDALGKFVAVNTVLYNRSVHSSAGPSTDGVTLQTMDGLDVPDSLRSDVEAVDQLIGHVVSVASERDIPWQAFTFPSATAEQVQSVRWSDYTDEYLNLPALSLARLFVEHTDLTRAYKAQKDALLEVAPSILPRVFGAPTIVTSK